jgi:hypothetical protein
VPEAVPEEELAVPPTPEAELVVPPTPEEVLIVAPAAHAAETKVEVANRREREGRMVFELIERRARVLSVQGRRRGEFGTVGLSSSGRTSSGAF